MQLFVEFRGIFRGIFCRSSSASLVLLLCSQAKPAMETSSWFSQEINEEQALLAKLRRYHANRESPLAEKVRASKLPCYILQLDDELLLRIFIYVSQEDLLALSQVCLRFFRVSRSVMKLCVQHLTWRLDPALFLHSSSNIPHNDADHSDSDSNRSDEDEDEDEDEDSVVSLFRRISTHEEPATQQPPLVVRYMQLRQTEARAKEPVFRQLDTSATFSHAQNVMLMGMIHQVDRGFFMQTDGGRFLTLPFANHEQYQQWLPSLPARIEEWKTNYPHAKRSAHPEASVHFYSKHLLTLGLTWLCYRGLQLLQDFHTDLRFSPATAAVIQAVPEVLTRAVLYPLELATDRLWAMLNFSPTADCGDLMLTCTMRKTSVLSLITKFFNRHAETAPEIQHQRKWVYTIVAQILRESTVSPWTGLGLALLETFGIEAGSFYLASKANGIRSYKPADIFCYQPSRNFYKFCLQPLRCVLSPLRLRSTTEGVPGRPEQPQRPSENILLNPLSLTSQVFQSLDPTMHLKAVITTLFDPVTFLYILSDAFFQIGSGSYRRHY